ncbi:hypothetical protein [Modestobacter lapidis]|nr:hypothetical protein [Modestobacter lapidis]
MTDAAGSTGHGSTAYRGTAGQPLADQPTEVVPLDRYEIPHETSYDPAHATQRFDPPSSRRDDDHLADLLGEPDDTGDGDDGRDGDQDWAPDHSTAPVSARRADTLAGLLLLLAGMAAGVSLLVVWVNGGGTGLDLVRAGLDDARQGAATLGGTGSWQPLAVVGGGIALFVLGLLMYAPARTHRFLGVLALLVSLVVAAGVLVPLADANWNLPRWAVGAWFTAAVAGLGLLGALKALSTGPKPR